MYLDLNIYTVPLLSWGGGGVGGEKEGLNEKRRDLRDVDVVSTVWRRRREILRVGNTFHSA